MVPLVARHERKGNHGVRGMPVRCNQCTEPPFHLQIHKEGGPFEALLQRKSDITPKTSQSPIISKAYPFIKWANFCRYFKTLGVTTALQ